MITIVTRTMIPRTVQQILKRQEFIGMYDTCDLTTLF